VDALLTHLCRSREKADVAIGREKRRNGFRPVFSRPSREES
jgi:hypothetical protein